MIKLQLTGPPPRPLEEHALMVLRAGVHGGVVVTRKVIKDTAARFDPSGEHPVQVDDKIVGRVIRLEARADGRELWAIYLPSPGAARVHGAEMSAALGGLR